MSKTRKVRKCDYCDKNAKYRLTVEEEGEVKVLLECEEHFNSLNENDSEEYVKVIKVEEVS